MRKIAAAFIVCILLLAAADVALSLWADTLYRETLSGEAVSAGADTVMTWFDLQAEEEQNQTVSRVNAWLSHVASQEVAVSSVRGKLAGTLYEPLSAQTNPPVAIVLHGGLGTNREQVLDIACALSIEGYRVLTPDLFAHGESEGDASTLGYGDAVDVHAWIGFVKESCLDARIVLFGIDEGANAVLLAASEGLDRCVDAVAADSACDDGISRLMGLTDVKTGAFRRAMLTSQLKKSASNSTLTISDSIAQADVPLLLIHGTGDQVVPAWHSEDIALVADAQLLYIEGAGHGLSRFVDAQTYYHALLRFYDAALNEE